MRIDPERFLDDLRTLRTFGATGTGVARQSYSDVDLVARRWLRDRMADAGLDATIDGVGNVIGRSRNDGPALLIGSHSDTQPIGGWLDGAYGVIAAIEVARALRDDPDTADLAVDAVAWVDEEGSYVSCLGSRSFCGLVDDDEIATARGPDGEPLTVAWQRAGLGGSAPAPAAGRYAGYLELHIEQGANLELAGNRIGVVTSIVGSRDRNITFIGEQNHAGTTPMHRRRDAAMHMIRTAARLDEAIAELAGDATVWTIGRLAAHPGAASIVPGRAEMHLQFRDPDRTRLEAIDEAVERVCADADDRIAVELEREVPIQPAAMDRELRRHLGDAAAALAPDAWVEMPSAAVHDAMFLAEVMPAAMLFVPSINGISHDVAEDTADDDLVLGCAVLADAAARVLAG